MRAGGDANLPRLSSLNILQVFTSKTCKQAVVALLRSARMSAISTGFGAWVDL